jgi:hypothetical protein
MRDGSSRVAVMDRDVIRIAVIAIVAVALARFVVPKLPGVGPVVGQYL